MSTGLDNGIGGVRNDDLLIGASRLDVQKMQQHERNRAALMLIIEIATDIADEAAQIIQNRPAVTEAELYNWICETMAVRLPLDIRQSNQTNLLVSSRLALKMAQSQAKTSQQVGREVA